MTIIRNFLGGSYNGHWLARLVRTALMAGIAAAALAVAGALPGIDIPGNYDVVVVGLAVPFLTGVDKWARGSE